MKSEIHGNFSQALLLTGCAKGTEIIIETVAGDSSLMAMSANGDLSWEVTVIGIEDIRRRAGLRPSQDSQLKFWEKALLGFSTSAESKMMGEIPSYTLVRSLREGAMMIINGHFHPGRIVSRDAETAPMLVRQGGFLCCEGGVTLEMSPVSKDDSVGESFAFRAKELGMAYFQKISGRGTYWLEVDGDFIEVKIPPQKTLAVDPMRLYAMSTSMVLVKFVSNGDAKTRGVVGRDRTVLLSNESSSTATVMLTMKKQESHYTGT